MQVNADLVPKTAWTFPAGTGVDFTFCLSQVTAIHEPIKSYRANYFSGDG